MRYEIIKKRNYLVDIFKFIAATMVVGIHCAPLNSYNQFLNNVIFQGVSRIAVPFFFMISSFFLFSKMKLEVGKESIDSLYKKDGTTIFVLVYCISPTNYKNKI